MNEVLTLVPLPWHERMHPPRKHYSAYKSHLACVSIVVSMCDWAGTSVTILACIQ